MRTFYACYECWQSEEQCECPDGYDSPLNHPSTPEYNAMSEEERDDLLKGTIK